MYKFIFITDIHLADVGPSSRTDNYKEAIFSKLKQVFEFAIKHKVQDVICGGDIFHIPNVSDETFNQFTTLVKNYYIKFYYIIGNHDIRKESIELAHKTKIGILEHVDCFRNLVKFPIINKHVFVCGNHYHKEDECKTIIKIPIKREKGKVNIAVLHQMIGKENLTINGEVKIVSYKNIEIYPQMDLILSGHYHPGFGIKRVTGLNGTMVYANPCSLARITIQDWALGVKPGFIYGTVANGRVEQIKRFFVSCSKKPFDIRKHIRHIKNEKLKQKFCEVLQKFKESSFLFDSNLLKTKLDLLLSKPPKELENKITKELIEEIWEAINE